VNIGIRAGLLGWAILAVWLWILWRTYTRVRRALAHDKTLFQMQLGVSLALLSAMLNAWFHNAGLFTPELATISVLGIFLAFTNLAKKRNPLRTGVSS
jgi:hypothetical protein